MFYLVSAIILLVIFASGFLIVRIRPNLVDKAVTKIVALGFFFQVAVNWLFWGNLADLLMTLSADKASVKFLFLCLISIFVYAGALALLYKAHDFYNGD